eukprot:m.227346 g.227346  ORF g.227346 m.227346 type:complete len:1024 (-) comp22368_c1_seq2:74-3145(-)
MSLRGTSAEMDDTLTRSQLSRKKKRQITEHDLGHKFYKKSFRKPTYCQHCADLLWGFMGQGLMCEVCNFVCHERCSPHLLHPCTSIIANNISTPVTHQWTKQKLKKKFFCNVCRLFLESDCAFCCANCGCWAHEDCRDQALDNCRPAATYVDKPGERSQRQLTHWWKEGNLSSKAVCAVCTKSCYSSHCLFGLRCGWCFLTVHANCQRLLTSGCSMSELGPVTLPPGCVSMGCTVPRDELGGEEKEDDPKKLQDSLLKGGFRELGIYEGDFRSVHSACKRVVAQDNMTASLLTELALKAYRIYDNPDFYDIVEVCYRIGMPKSEAASGAALRQSIVEEGAKVTAGWKCGSCFFHNSTVRLDCELCGVPDASRLDSQQMTARVLDADERIGMIFEDHEPGYSYYFFISSQKFQRMKEESRGVLRVYPAPELDAAASFKTLPIDAETTARDVVRALARKFGVVEESDLFLQEIRYNNQGQRQFSLADTDCPFKLKIKFGERCVSEGLQRFYLRKKSESGDRPSSLYVTNFPKGMSAEDVRANLSRILDADDVRDYSIPIVIPPCGCAVIETRTPEVADVVASVLRMSQVKGRQLGVLWLPVIQSVPERCCPLLVFVNSKSGGGQGQELFSILSTMLNPYQVFDVTQNGPLPGFAAFRNVASFRVLVAGGDGTVGWVLSTLEDFRALLKCPLPHVGVLPVGTGNDLSRVLNWGPGYSGQRLRPILQAVMNEADTVMVDRWKVRCVSGNGCQTETTMTNYFGVGIDAAIALDFHELRQAHPERFTSRTKNKGHYVSVGVSSLIKQPCKDVFTDMLLWADGKDILLPDVQGIIVLNIPSYSAGADPWGTDKDENFTPPSYNDGLLEVVGVYGVMHLSHISAHLRSGKRIGQFKEIRVTILSEIPLQVDGEPWRQQPCCITISRTGQVPMLARIKHKKKAQRAATAKPSVDDSSIASSRPATLLRQRSGSVPNLSALLPPSGYSSSGSRTGTIRSTTGSQGRSDDSVSVASTRDSKDGLDCKSKDSSCE